MEYRTLGRTGIRVSPISIGTWQLSGPVNVDGHADGFPDSGAEHAVRLIRACADLGINCIDTAPIYGAGEGERRVGEAIRGQRDRWVVSTKVGMDVDASGARLIDTTPRAIEAGLKASLRRLGTDYVDVFLYHAAPALDSILEGREVLEALKKAGQLRAYGISTTHAEELERSVQRGAVEVVMLQQSLRAKPGKMIALAEQRGLGVMVRGALASGFLSGHYAGGHAQFAADDIRRRFYFDPRDHDLFARVKPEGMAMADFALRYVLDQPTTHTLVLGGRSLAHYQHAARVAAAPRLDAARHQLADGVRLALDGYRTTRATVSRLTKPLRARLAGLR